MSAKIKIAYLTKELGILAWAASVQRAQLYESGSDLSTKRIAAFRLHVTEFLFSQLLPRYKGFVTEEQHYENLNALIEYASRQGKSVIGKEGYKYGVAQKLLNLTLKYHWCLGLAEEPPHCPVDRIVINKTQLRGKINWTQISKREEYENVIKDVRRLAEAKGVSIAIWGIERGRSSFRLPRRGHTSCAGAQIPESTPRRKQHGIGIPGNNIY